MQTFYNNSLSLLFAVPTTRTQSVFHHISDYHPATKLLTEGEPLELSKQ